MTVPRRSDRPASPRALSVLSPSDAPLGVRQPVTVANPLFLAAPTQIPAAIAGLAESGELLRHLGISAVEFALGYVIACVLGIVAGLAMANSAVVKRAMTPWVPGSMPRPPSRSRRCSSCGSGSASGRRC